MRAACSGQAVPGRASDAFVEKVFDDFAASFEAKLAQLAYRAPQLVAAMLADAGVEPAKALDVLDAGCGTGLCGPLLAPYARRLIGVDLSAGMLAQASDKGLYDELVHGELTEFLRGASESFDVVASADTLVYFGAIEAVVAAAASALRPGGLLIFSVEEAEAGDAVTGYGLKPHGRYVHTKDYVERVVTGAGLQADVVRAELRMESGAPVAGLVARATKLPVARTAIASAPVVARAAGTAAALGGGDHA
jgi:predicted TPR repeat methyltransferase